mgnify:CR=1 FL=1
MKKIKRLPKKKVVKKGNKLPIKKVTALRDVEKHRKHLFLPEKAEGFEEFPVAVKKEVIKVEEVKRPKVDGKPPVKRSKSMKITKPFFNRPDWMSFDEYREVMMKPVEKLKIVTSNKPSKLAQKIWEKRRWKIANEKAKEYIFARSLTKNDF